MPLPILAFLWNVGNVEANAKDFCLVNYMIWYFAPFEWNVAYIITSEPKYNIEHLSHVVKPKFLKWN